jgi:hypothetical protein
MIIYYICVYLWFIGFLIFTTTDAVEDNLSLRVILINFGWFITYPIMMIWIFKNNK